MNTDTKLLVLVHPGSTCGSADFHHGRSYATAERAALAALLDGWTGGLLVVDSDLSDEIASYPLLAAAIDAALDRAETTGHSSRLLAGDAQDDYDGTDWVPQVREHVLSTGVRNAVITGAWYHEDDDHGCVNAVYDVLHEAGLSVEVHDSAFPIDVDR